MQLDTSAMTTTTTVCSMNDDSLEPHAGGDGIESPLPWPWSDDDDSSSSSSSGCGSSLTLEAEILQQLDETFHSIKEVDALRDFIHDEGFLDVLDHMQSCRESQAVQEKACHVLLHCVRIDTGSMMATQKSTAPWRLRMNRRDFQELQTSLLQHNIVPILSLAMQSFSQSQVLAHYCMTVLAKLVPAQQLLVVVDVLRDNSSTQTTTSTTTCNNIPSLAVAVLRIHLMSEPTVVAILSACLTLGKQSRAFCQALVDHEIVWAVRLVLEVHGHEHVDATGLACQLLFLLGDQCVHTNCRHLASSLPELVQVVAPTQQHQRQHHATTLMAACGVLWHLANASEKLKRRIVLHTRCIQYLVRLLLLDYCWLDPDVMTMVCGTLCALSLSNDMRVLRKLSQSLMLDALGPIWYHYQDVEAIIEPILVVLIRMDAFRAFVLGETNVEEHEPLLNLVDDEEEEEDENRDEANGRVHYN